MPNKSVDMMIEALEKAIDWGRAELRLNYAEMLGCLSRVQHRIQREMDEGEEGDER